MLTPVAAGCRSLWRGALDSAASSGCAVGRERRLERCGKRPGQRAKRARFRPPGPRGRIQRVMEIYPEVALEVELGNFYDWIRGGSN